VRLVTNNSQPNTYPPWRRSGRFTARGLADGCSHVEDITGIDPPWHENHASLNGTPSTPLQPANWSAAGEGMGPLRAGWGAAQGWARVHSAPSGQLHAHTPPPLRHHLLAHYPNRKVYVSDSSCTLLESTTYRF
jgi:hypothetical protein